MPKEKYEILDANALFIKIFPYNEYTSKKQEIDRELARIFNNRISEELDSSDKDMLENLKKMNLSKAQLVLLRQIEEW